MQHARKPVAARVKCIESPLVQPSIEHTVGASMNTPGWQRLAALPYIVALCVVLGGGLIMQVRFLPRTGSGLDGFQSQLISVLVALEAGGFVEASQESPLLWSHLGRLVAAAPFLLGETIFGPVGQLALLSAALLPLVLRLYRESGSVVSMLPLLLPLAVSGRGVLTAAGVAYLVLYLQSARGNSWHLWLGGLWVNLSSASVLMALLLMCFARNPNLLRRFGVQYWLVAALLSAVLVASGIDKFTGFAAGYAGYQAHAFQSSNVFLVALSRSTLISSFVDGNYLRGVVYIGIASYFLFKSFTLLIRPDRKGLRRVVICCLTGIPLEGLGMLALIFPLIWLFLNYDPSGPVNSNVGKVVR